MSDPHSVHILGAGSIGLLVASYLASNHPVTLIRRPGSAPGTTRTIHRSEDERIVALEVAQHAADRLPGEIQRLIVCTKAYDAREAVMSVAGSLGTEAAVLLMQNGLGSQDEVLDALPETPVAAATTTEGAWRRAADEVIHAGRGETRIGALRGEGPDWAALLNAAGLRASNVSDIRQPLADKLRVNALINPLTVLHDCRNGELLGKSAAMREMAALGEETDRVLAAAGHVFPVSALERAMSVAETTAANHSSMLQDARAGRRLEIDYINGYVIRLGERLGVATPVNRRVVREVNSLIR
ncbi:MAG: 2-dehydropantoate 2-reductase [Ectothiorhodospiraceae bacterium]|jgi:2-dehydropantoate 2-reductase